MNPINNIFNPYEIAFCGHSGSGKTALITKLIKGLTSSLGFQIGYVKNEVHEFEIDRENKDTNLAAKNGAAAVFISDKNHFATVTRGNVDPLTRSAIAARCDIIFVEGHKASDLLKVIFIDPKKRIMEDIEKGHITNCFALVGEAPIPAASPNGIPYYHRDDIAGIRACVLKRLNAISNKIPIIGLVLAGGASSRMGKDKSQLQYHGKTTQANFAGDLLAECCREVLISCRKEQAGLFKNSKYPLIFDRFLNVGPAGGVLTAMQDAPNAAWLVAACDLPYLNAELIKHLLKSRDPFKMATAFVRSDDNKPEPLLTLYEPKSFPILMHQMSEGNCSLRNLLLQNRITPVNPPNGIFLLNVNTPEEYQKVKKEIAEH